MAELATSSTPMFRHYAHTIISESSLLGRARHRSNQGANTYIPHDFPNRKLHQHPFSTGIYSALLPVGINLPFLD